MAFLKQSVYSQVINRDGKLFPDEEIEWLLLIVEVFGELKFMCRIIKRGHFFALRIHLFAHKKLAHKITFICL